MDLSPSEAALIEMIRGETVPAFTITVTVNEHLTVVTTSNPQDGVIIGAGHSFDAAYMSLCGVESPTDGLSDGEPAGPRH